MYWGGSHRCWYWEDAALYIVDWSGLVMSGLSENSVGFIWLLCLMKSSPCAQTWGCESCMRIVDRWIIIGRRGQWRFSPLSFTQSSSQSVSHFVGKWLMCHTFTHSSVLPSDQSVARLARELVKVLHVSVSAFLVIHWALRSFIHSFICPSS